MNINFSEYYAETMRKLENPGLLLASSNKQGKNNVMTIGWGLIGIFGEKPVFLVSIRSSSYTNKLIENSGEFTINVPEDGMDDIVKYCGEVSGREHDKPSECKLNLLKSKTVGVPVIGQCKWHYECRVLNEFQLVPKHNLLRFLTRMIVTAVLKSLNRHNNIRNLYFGEILAVY